MSPHPAALWLSQASKANLDLLASAFSHQDKRSLNLGDLVEQRLEGVECECRLVMSGPQIDDPNDRLQGGHGELAEVTIVSQHHPSFLASPPEKHEIVGADEMALLHVEDVASSPPQGCDDLRVDVLIRQERDILQPQCRISAVITTSFSRNRDAYRNACSTSSALRCE